MATTSPSRRTLRGRLLPHGRHPHEQPNVAPDAALTLDARIWLLVALVGVATGLAGAALMLLLHTVERLAFPAPHGTTFLQAVRLASAERRVAVLCLAGVIAGVGWFVLRRTTRGGADLDDALWTRDGDIPFPRSLGTSVLSEIVVGMGTSLGREAAPKQMGAAFAGLFARWSSLSPAQKRLLVACGGGAGMAAVYNVPLGGALITAEILYGSLSIAVVLPALACSFIATAAGWVYLPVHATYRNIPSYNVAPSHVVWALVAGPVIGVVSVAWVRLIGYAESRRPTGRTLLVAPLAAFAALGLVGIAYPQLFGNGQDMAHDAFVANGGLVVFAVLFALKPLVTAACLGSGASGGLFTPTLSTGAVLGATLGALWTHLWPGTPVGSYAVIGAAAMIGAAMQAPLAGLALVLELTHTTDRLMVPMIAATVLATLVARTLDGYSIYSARLPARDRQAGQTGSPAKVRSPVTR